MLTVLRPYCATFSYRWLRDACTCPSCLHPSTQQKLHRSSDVPASISPEIVETITDGVHIAWSGPDRHRSFFPLSFLATHASPPALHAFRQDVPAALWPTPSALLAFSENDLDIPYSDLGTPRGLLRAITQLQRTGLLFVRGVPHSRHERCGLRETFYGGVWDVRDVVDSRNIAYTSLFLGLHMDLQYFEAPPRFQVLHCLRNRVQGGTSLFVDAFAAASALRAAHPADFARLVDTPVPFQYINDSRHLHHAHPTISLSPASASPDGEPHITGVSYSPPFQAPLPRDTPSAFYDALGRFAALVEAPTAVHARRFSEGDAVVFDNQRVLHGRTAFKERSGPESVGKELGRWLKGGYFEGDQMASHGRVLRARAARGEI
ncbi:gamma-butyrobetaine hydroxylase [Lactarius pseudohatsudake]|nr:gamma-butyrobetaine hydroxylase [Lactarius pseudohatsudake]